MQLSNIKLQWMSVTVSLGILSAILHKYYAKIMLALNHKDVQTARL